MSDAGRAKKSILPLAIGLLLIAAGVFANVFVVYQRQQFVEQTLRCQAEIEQLSKQIAINQEIINSIPEKRKLINKLQPALYATFDKFNNKDYQQSLPEELLPSDSRFLYVCQWEQFRERSIRTGRSQFQESGNRWQGLQGLIYIPDSSQHKLVICSRGKNDSRSQFKEDVVKFAIQGPGWTRYGWQLEKQENDSWTLATYCNNATQSIELPKVRDINHGGRYGQHQVLAEQNLAWQNGWQRFHLNKNELIPISLKKSWLIMFPIMYEFEHESGLPSSEFGRHIFVALESDEPMHFRANDYRQLEKNNDPRVDKMTLDLATGNYVYKLGN